MPYRSALRPAGVYLVVVKWPGRIRVLRRMAAIPVVAHCIWMALPASAPCVSLHLGVMQTKNPSSVFSVDWPGPVRSIDDRGGLTVYAINWVDRAPTYLAEHDLRTARTRLLATVRRSTVSDRGAQLERLLDAIKEACS